MGRVLQQLGHHRSRNDGGPRRTAWHHRTDTIVPSSWWQRGVFYQIYPRSFAEGHRAGIEPSGVGNLRGIIDHLDHLEWLGVDAVWLSPFYRSPMADFGYDVADFCAVDPMFGTLADVDDLLGEAHARDIRVIVDWVPNHTSDQHPWFVESRSSRDNPKADWYVWRDEPVNNWRAAFPRGEQAWQWDAAREQYYLRNFTRHQPDLNWDHPEVEAAMHDTLRFWLDRGVDGFRMDVVHLIGKDLAVNDPVDVISKSWSHVPVNDVPITHERLRRIRAVLDEYDGERVAVGEVFLLDESKLAAYHGRGDELHLTFNFPFLWADADAEVLRQRIETTLSHLDPAGAWPTWVLSNHDFPRHRHRHGGCAHTARMMAVLLMTLPGTPFMYQGECLGLLDADVPDHLAVDPGGRDGCRAPIPWDDGDLHGWPTPTWLPFPPDAAAHSVARLRDDPTSIMWLYRSLLALRHTDDELLAGRFEFVDRDRTGPEVLAYRRGDRLVVLNFGDDDVETHQLVDHDVRLLISSRHDHIDPGVVPGRTAIVATPVA
jgi:alpha-glucosidase